MSREDFDGGYHEWAKEQHQKRVADTPRRIEYAIEQFEQNGIIDETLQVLFGKCVMWVNSVPVIDTQAVNEIFGEGYITEINQDYINHYARGIKK